MKNMTDIKVGDTVWIADANSRGREPAPAVVQKVGRKLLTVNGSVFRIETGYGNDGYSHRRVIPDIEEYRRKKERDAIWTAIRGSYGLSDSITLEAVKEAARLLGIEK